MRIQKLVSISTITLTIELYMIWVLLAKASENSGIRELIKHNPRCTHASIVSRELPESNIALKH